MKTFTLCRRKLELEAAPITAENIFEVAEWCHGKVVCEGKLNAEGTNIYIELMSLVNRNQEKVHAHLGDWITAGKPFKVYKQASIDSIFELKDSRKYDSILAFVRGVMYEQNEATLRGFGTDACDDLAISVTQKIYNLM
jgi:hypothetical protein